MPQYIHEGHQGKERCLLRARNTVFWPKITYDIQELIERCIICQEHGKSQSIIGTTQELPPFPWHTLATDIFYWKRMDFLIVAAVFSKYFLVRKLANSSSAALCAEIATIVTELGLPHIIRSDNGPCYNSKEFQQLLQLPSTLGAQEMYETHQELIRRQQHKPEKNYIELTPGMAVWVQQRQNTSWEPATVVSQGSSNSYWIMQENSTDQPRVYRRTRSMLKIRCTNVQQTRHNYSQSTETEKAKFQTPSTYNDERNLVKHNSVKKISDNLVHPTKSDTTSTSASIFSEEREEIAANFPAPADVPAPTPAPTLLTVEEQLYTPGSRKSTRKNLGKSASTFSDFYM